MPISSISKVVDTQDPILETDLELLAKVDTYEQSKFDAGTAALQDEVNKWAMMSNIAKPELKSYASQKINNLVNGINNLGGVNLSDINNVNSLKALGYNIYGDQRIVDGIATTQRMRALQTNSQAKLSGKDGDKYDATVATYLMKGYNEWTNDGNADNARYDGPVDIPQGNMNTINKKVTDYLKELKPDSDATPSGDLQKSYGYFQVDGKWLKGNRIEEAINAVTDENDSLIFKAHGWSALGSDTDNGLKSKLGLIYDNTSSSIKNQINYLQAELNQTTDAGRKIEINRLIGEQKFALETNDNEKNAWYNKPVLSSQEREGIQQSLYRNAWKSNIVNSYSYNQQKRELKANMPLIFHDRMQMQAEQWASDYNLRVADFEVRKQKTLFDMQQELNKNALSFSLNGGGNLPLTQEPNTGKTNQEKSPQGFIDDINAKYFGLNTGYYQYLYNVMGSNDTKERFEQVNGLWKPKPEYKDQIQSEIGLFSSKLDNYSNLTDEEKKQLNLPVSEDELKDIFNIRNQVNTYGAYKKMAEDKEDEAINNALASGAIDFDWRKVLLTIGYNREQKTVGDVLALYKAGIYNDETSIQGIGTKPNSTEGYDLNITSIKALQKSVDGMRKDAEKSYEKVGGNMFNSYSVPIPFTSIPKPLQEIMQKQLAAKVGNGDYTDIQPIKGQIVFNFQTGKPEYRVDVQSGTSKKLKTETIDVTDMVKTSPGSGIGLYFPKSDISLIWGLNLSKNGSTPFSQQNDYKDALRTSAGNYPYQIATITNSLNGTTGLKVKVALPVGDGKTVEVNVKNLQNGTFTFPSSIEAVQQYLNDYLSTPELKERFYKEHGLTLN